MVKVFFENPYSVKVLYFKYGKVCFKNSVFEKVWDFLRQIDFKFLPINYPLNTVIEELNQQLMKHLLIVNLPSMYIVQYTQPDCV